MAKVDKVIFIPIKLMDFSDDSLIQRYRNVLGMASPTKAIREAIRDLDILELEPHDGTIFSHLATDRILQDVRFRPFIATNIVGLRNTIFDTEGGGASGGGSLPTTPVPQANPATTTNVATNISGINASIKAALWSTNNPVGRLSTSSIYLFCDPTVTLSSFLSNWRFRATLLKPKALLWHHTLDLLLAVLSRLLPPPVLWAY